jgi:hypothetical protein
VTTDPPVHIAFVPMDLKGSQLSPESKAVCDHLLATWSAQPFELVFVCGHKTTRNEDGQQVSAASLAVRYLRAQGLHQVFAINDRAQSSYRMFAAFMNVANSFANDRKRLFAITVLVYSRMEAIKYALIVQRGYSLNAEMVVIDDVTRLRRLPRDIWHASEMLTNYIEHARRS